MLLHYSTLLDVAALLFYYSTGLLYSCGILQCILAAAGATTDHFKPGLSYNIILLYYFLHTTIFLFSTILLSWDPPMRPCGSRRYHRPPQAGVELY